MLLICMLEGIYDSARPNLAPLLLVDPDMIHLECVQEESTKLVQKYN